MRKTILFTAFLFNILVGLSQEHYSFPLETKLLDIPGNNFLAYRFDTDKTIIQETDQFGSVIWQDTILFWGGSGTVKLNSLTSFKGTDEYLLIMTRNLSNSTIDDNDIIYQYSKFSTLNQNQLHYIDTLTQIGTETLSMNDTSVYLFNYKNTIPPTAARDIETYTINPDLEQVLIAPKDSIYSFSAGFFYEDKDTIYRLSRDPYSVFNQAYVAEDITNFELNYYELPPAGNYYYQYACLGPVAEDSILLISDATTSGSSAIRWFFAWLDYDMNLRSSKLITSYSRFDIHSALVTDDRIYFVADSMDISIYEGTYLFVYDFSFNLICKTRIFGPSFLQKINELPYLVFVNGLEIDYNLVDACQLLLVPEEAKKASLSLYPNPVNDFLTIENPLDGTLDITLRDFEGRILVKHSSGEKKISLDMGTFSKGIYFVEISGGSEKQFRKIVKN